jgi:indolepyruvate ferredoxin oxidoreductase beta subunit
MQIRPIKDFNIVIVGTGGQGLITLLQIIAQAAMKERYNLRTSELHGLSQRGGSVEVHIRFGRKIYSPMVTQGKADLILSLEIQESLRAAYFANPQTKFLIDKYLVPIPSQTPLSESQIKAALKKISKNVNFVPAFAICQKEFGTGVTGGIYLLTLASFKGLIPLKPAVILLAIKKVIPEKYLDLNVKTFELARKHEKN